MTSFVVHDLETFQTKRAVPYTVSLYRLSEKDCKHKRHLTKDGYEKRKEDTIVCNWTDCMDKNLDWIVKLKGESDGVEGKIAEYE